jgi:hypothetical protein
MRIRILLACALVAAGGCFGNTHGQFAATRFGDITQPPVEHARFDAALTAACGDGTPTADGTATIARLPYLQQVTSRSAMILFTTAVAGARVVATTPDGAPIAIADALVDESAQPAHGRQLIAHLHDLPASSIVCYQVFRGSLALTARAGFKTAPLPGSPEHIRFIAIGDSGGGGRDQFAVRDAMSNIPADLILHLGDAAFPSGSLAQLEEKVFSVYHSLLRSIPIYPATGNHEYGSSDADPFREVFALPENGGPEGRERWYSFDYGQVHFVALDTERMSETQAAWLEHDLSATHMPWVVVFGHKPPYSSGEHGSDSRYDELFVPILTRHHVALVLSGHDHDYERMKPMSGVTYIVSGGGGVGTRPVGHSGPTAFSLSVLHFLAVDVDGDTMTVHAIDATGREFDSTLIRRATTGATSAGSGAPSHRSPG